MRPHWLLEEEKNYLEQNETKSFCSTIFWNHHSKSLTTTESVWPSSGYSKNVWPWSPYSRPSHTFSCPEKVDPLYTLAYNLHPYNADFLQAIHPKRGFYSFVNHKMLWSGPFTAGQSSSWKKTRCLQFKRVTIWPCRDVELTLNWQNSKAIAIPMLGNLTRLHSFCLPRMPII